MTIKELSFEVGEGINLSILSSKPLNDNQSLLA